MEGQDRESYTDEQDRENYTEEEKFDRFKELVEEWATENLACSGCRFCHEQGIELSPNDYKGSYEKNMKKLWGEINEQFKH